MAHHFKDPETGCTVRQELFCQYYVNTGGYNKTECAISAGYAQQSAYVRACELLRMEHVQKRIYDLTAKRLHNSGAVALDTLEKVVTGEISSPASVRVNAALAILDRAGHRHAQKIEVEQTLNPAQLDAEITRLLALISPPGPDQSARTADLERVPDQTLIEVLPDPDSSSEATTGSESDD